MENPRPDTSTSRRSSARPLTPGEIALLEGRGCRAEDWSLVTAAEHFTPGKRFRDVVFSGRVELGSCDGSVRHPDGFVLPAGIECASLHNVRVGDGCLIRRARIADADIGDQVVIEDVGCLSRRGDAPFANGSPAHVLTEDGARAVPLWSGLSAQIAHLICHSKNSAAARALEELIRHETERLRTLPRSVVSSGCRVIRTRYLRDVWLGENVSVIDAAGLENCWLAGDPAVPAVIGEGVAASDCVFLAASTTTGGVRLEHCLAGEGVRLEKNFAGKHSLFFANSTFALGEASCAMAGPFAVSTHKATLVLTCQCSFATFGSGANSSNHHFKLGPRHGGVLRRGVKCGSGSYVFWPSDIGAFSTVVGRHTTHLDTTDFPFSLLVGENSRSILVPGVNLFSSGCFRDGWKWHERDARAGLANPLDLINPAILSPYVLQAMERGMDILRRASVMSADLRLGGVVIPAQRLEPAMRLYREATLFHLGERLLRRAAAVGGGEGAPDSDDVCRTIAGAASIFPDPAAGEWRDWGGMLLPGAEAERILAEAAEGAFPDMEAFRTRLGRVHAEYDRLEVVWLARRWVREYGEPSRATVAAFADQWRAAVRFRHACFLKDAGKEFAPDAKLGFGVEEPAAEVFARVRGELAEHPLTLRVAAEREALLALAERLL